MASIDMQLDNNPQEHNDNNYALAQQSRPRGLIGQISAVLLQPVSFFRALPLNRTWLFVAILMLVAHSAAAIKQAEQAASADSGAPSDAGMFDPMMMGGGDMMMGDPMMGGDMSMDFSGIPSGMTPGTPSSGGSASNATQTTWTTALIASASLILIWGIQAILLSEVSLFNGRAPSLSHNFKIAVWASVPLTLMLLVQMAYYAAGGVAGAEGLAGLVQEWDGFAGQSPLIQALIISLASRLTLFWLWSLLLLYYGARHALRGRWWASLLVVIAWVLIVVVIPVATGDITAPEEAPADEGGMFDPSFDPSMMGEDFDPSMLGGGEFDPSMMGEDFDPSMSGGGEFDPSMMGEDFDPSMSGGGEFDPSMMGEDDSAIDIIEEESPTDEDADAPIDAAPLTDNAPAEAPRR